MIVREAFPSEMDIVGELRVAAYQAQNLLAASPEYADTLRTLGIDGVGEVLVAVEDAQVLGTVMLVPFPPMFGGVFQYVDQYTDGVKGFVARANSLADRYGERFRPPALLTDQAVAAGSLREALA